MVDFFIFDTNIGSGPILYIRVAVWPDRIGSYKLLSGCNPSGCRKECRVSETCHLYDNGTIKQGIPQDKSQIILPPHREIGDDLRVSDDRESL